MFVGGRKLFLVFITCNFSPLIMEYFLKENSQSTQKIQEMMKLVKNHCGLVEALICDGGLEINKRVEQQFFKENGIESAIINPHILQQTGSA